MLDRSIRSISCYCPTLGVANHIHTHTHTPGGIEGYGSHLKSGLTSAVRTTRLVLTSSLEVGGPYHATQNTGVAHMKTLLCDYLHPPETLEAKPPSLLLFSST